MASGFTQGKKAFDAVWKAMNGKAAIDRKSVDKVWKQMVAVVKLCANPRLNITSSPPCILDILPDTYAHLQTVLDKCDNLEVLNECPYFRLLLANLAEKCRQVLQLFKVSRESIFEEDSIERRSLTKYALIFSHMFTELKALYPNGVCIGKGYPITKSAAEEFWRRHFNDKYFVPWRDFVGQFESEHTIRSNMEVIALKSTIDITCNDHVSIFEFDVFTRLFQPWGTIVRNWNILAVTHPGYQAFLTYDEVKDKLLKITSNRTGSYLFRLSCTRLGQWAIGHITPEGGIVQTIPQNKSLIHALLDGQTEGFYLHPMGQEANPDLTGALTGTTSTTIQVTQEQYELYMEIDSSFELCKICTINPKNKRIEPCRHLVCNTCLEQWMDSNGTGCPFCRMEIKSTESVVVRPYQKADSTDALVLAVESSKAPQASVSEDPPVSSSTERQPRPALPSGGQSTRSSSPCPVPPIPFRRSPSLRNGSNEPVSPTARPRHHSNATALGKPAPPALPGSSISERANSVSKADRPPLPALPVSNPDPLAAYPVVSSDPLSIPPIDYSSSKECAGHIMPDYSTPGRRPSASPSVRPPHENASATVSNTSAPTSVKAISPPSSPASSRRPTASSVPLEVRLAGMGYAKSDVQKAVLIAGDNLELALKILDNFKTQEKKTLAEQLMDMGYEKDDVKKAISVAGDNRDLAVMILQQFAANN